MELWSLVKLQTTTFQHLSNILWLSEWIVSFIYDFRRIPAFFGGYELNFMRGIVWCVYLFRFIVQVIWNGTKKMHTTHSVKLSSSLAVFSGFEDCVRQGIFMVGCIEYSLWYCKTRNDSSCCWGYRLGLYCCFPFSHVERIAKKSLLCSMRQG